MSRPVSRRFGARQRVSGVAAAPRAFDRGARLGLRYGESRRV